MTPEEVEAEIQRHGTYLYGWCFADQKWCPVEGPTAHVSHGAPRAMVLRLHSPITIAVVKDGHIHNGNWYRVPEGRYAALPKEGWEARA